MWCTGVVPATEPPLPKSEKPTQVDKKILLKRGQSICSVILTPSPWGSCLYIHVCMQAPPSIRWGFDGDIYSPLVTPLRWANGELSSQRHGGELMFRNGSRLDDGDLTHPGAATITGRTILEVFLVPAHGCGQYRQPISAHQLPPYS